MINWEIFFLFCDVFFFFLFLLTFQENCTFPSHPSELRYIFFLLALQDSGSDPVEKYKLKVRNEDGKEHEEEVDIDTEKEIERFHVPKTSSDNDEADVLFDYKKVI